MFIVTVERTWNNATSERPGYLTQTAASIDRLIKSDTKFGNKFLFICNVQNDPMSHIEAAYLKNFMPFVDKYGANNIGLNVKNIDKPTFKFNESVKPRRNQEQLDYIFCLNQAYKLNAKYILALQDDVIAYETCLMF